jgi:cytochrome c-type biogenesis protein CcmF
VLFVENPFVRFWQTAAGRQTVSLFQPAGSIPLIPSGWARSESAATPSGHDHSSPMLYLGFVSFVIPFAFAIAALITGRT